MSPRLTLSRLLKKLMLCGSSNKNTKQLLPLLMTALDLPDPNLRANVIDTLAVLVKEVSSEMVDGVNGIVVKLLKGLSSKGSVVRFPFPRFHLPHHSLILSFMNTETPTRFAGIPRPLTSSHQICDTSSAQTDCTHSARNRGRRQEEGSETSGGGCEIEMVLVWLNNIYIVLPSFNISHLETIAS